MQMGRPLLIWPIFLEHAKDMQISMQIPAIPPGVSKGSTLGGRRVPRSGITNQGPHCRDRHEFGVQAWSGGCPGSAAPAALQKTPLSRSHSST